MSAAALAAAWLLSALSLALPITPADAGGPSRALLAALPWIALAGLPRGADAARGARVTPALAAWLPLLCVGLGLDRAAGATPLATARVALWCALLVALPVRAAIRARGGARHALLWSAWVALPAVLLALPDRGGAWLAAVLEGTPLGWAVRELRPSGAAHGASDDLALLVSLLVFTVLAEAVSAPPSARGSDADCEPAVAPEDVR